MSSPSVSRGLFIGEVSKGERKKVGDSDLVEFYLDGFGLRFNAWKELSNKVPPVGSTVIIEGQIKSRTYQVEGKDRQTTEIVVSSIEAVGLAVTAPAQPITPPAPVAELPIGGF